MDTASPRQGGTPAQAEGSMPDGLRKLYGATEQVTEQVGEQVVVLGLQDFPPLRVSYLPFWATLSAIVATIPANSSIFS